MLLGINIPSKCDTPGSNKTKQHNTKTTQRNRLQQTTLGEAKKKARKFVLELVGIYGNGRVSNPCRTLHTTRLILLGLRSPCTQSSKPPT